MKTLNDLPLEVLRAILDSLDLKSLQNCLLVCRQWNKEIQSLAHKQLDICDLIDLQQAIDHYTSSPSQARKVRNITLNNQMNMDKEMFFKLSNTLPNVNCVTLSPSKLDRQEIDHTITWAALIQKWTNLTSINEHAREFASPSLKHLLTSSEKNTLLTSIHLRLRPDSLFSVSSRNHNVAKEVIHLLKHCPALQHLALMDAYVNTDDIQVLHQNAPQLESLHLKEILLLKRNVGDPAPKHTHIAIPASRMKEVFFSTSRKYNGVREERVHKDWLDYIAEKYPNLETLTFHAASREHNAHKRQQAHIKQLVKLVGNCLRLKQLHIALIGGFSEKLATALDKSNIRLESANVNGTAESVLEQLACLAKYQGNVKTLHMLTPYLKEAEVLGNVYDLGSGMRLFPNLQHVDIKKHYGSTFPYNRDESKDYCSFQLLHSLLKYCKKLESIRIEVGHPIKAFDDNMFLLFAAENLKKLDIRNMKYGLKETNYLNNVIFPNCPYLTAFSICYSNPKPFFKDRNKATHPDATHINLTHQHQLETLSIGNSGSMVLLNVVLPEESASTTTNTMAANGCWFMKYEGKMLQQETMKNTDQQHHTVLYIHPQCLDAFLDRPPPRYKSIAS